MLGIRPKINPAVEGQVGRPSNTRTIRTTSKNLRILGLRIFLWSTRRCLGRAVSRAWRTQIAAIWWRIVFNRWRLILVVVRLIYQLSIRMVVMITSREFRVEWLEWTKHTLSLGVHYILRAQKGRLSQKREKQFVIFSFWRKRLLVPKILELSSIWANSSWKV